MNETPNPKSTATLKGPKTSGSKSPLHGGRGLFSQLKFAHFLLSKGRLAWRWAVLGSAAGGLFACQPSALTVIKPTTLPVSTTVTTPATVSVTLPVVYAASYDGQLYALDTLTGQSRWSFRADTALQSSPAVAYGLVYVGGRDTKIYALDATTGRLRWTVRTNAPVYSSPAITDGRLVVGSQGRYALRV